MNKRVRAKRWLCVFICGTLGLAGCAVPPGGSGGGSSPAATSTQAGCIVGHVAMGAIAGAVLTGVLGGNSKAVSRSAVVGGLAGFATAWMRCINQFATPTTQRIAPLQAVADSGYSPQQGTVVRMRSAYLDPAAVSAGGRSTLRMAYLVMDPGREVTVNQTISYRFVSPDGTEQAAPPRMDKVVVEPGLQQVTLPLDIPPEITDGRLIATLAIEVNGRRLTSDHEIVVTPDSRRLDQARNDATRQRADFERVLADAGKGPVSLPARVQVAVAEPVGSKSVQASQRTLSVQIARANLREQPSAKAKLLGTASKGERLLVESEISGAEGRWLRVTVGGITGWVGASAGALE